MRRLLAAAAIVRCGGGVEVPTTSQATGYRRPQPRRRRDLVGAVTSARSYATCQSPWLIELNTMIDVERSPDAGSVVLLRLHLGRCPSSRDQLEDHSYFGIFATDGVDELAAEFAAARRSFVRYRPTSHRAGRK